MKTLEKHVQSLGDPPFALPNNWQVVLKINSNINGRWWIDLHYAKAFLNSIIRFSLFSQFSESFFTTCYYKSLISKKNILQSYVYECQIWGFLPKFLESLQRFLHQYARCNLFGNEKQTQLNFNKMLELHPYLNPKYNQPLNPSRSIIFNFENQHSPINFSLHIFETSTLNKEQKHIFTLLTSTNIGFHMLQGPLGSGKFFLWSI